MPTRVKRPPKEADNFYRSAEWLKLMRRLKRERGNRCQECGAIGGEGGARIIGDHIVERRDGGAPLDPNGIRLLCLPCHNKKTAKARAARRFS